MVLLPRIPCTSFTVPAARANLSACTTISVRDAISDQLAESVRHAHMMSVRHCLLTSPMPMPWRSIPSPMSPYNLKTDYIEEAWRPYHSRMTLKELRKRNAADKAAGQCRGDKGLSIDSLTTIVDELSYRQPPPVPPPSGPLCHPG